MNIKDFVNEVISQTIDGVKEAQSKYCSKFIIVPPVICPELASHQSNACVTHGTLRQTTEINFDMTLCVNETSQNEGGGGIAIQVFSVGAKTASGTQTGITQHISFTVPVALPTVKRDEAR